MAHANTDSVPVTNITEHQIMTSAEMTDEQRRIKAAELQKAEEVRQEKWATRTDVVHHFLAYRYFDRSSNCLDLLNFTDADVDRFNLTTNKSRGLDNWHVCAAYLKNLETPTPTTTTQRRKLIHHVRSFNETQPSHFRFYLCNLTADDIEYVEGLSKTEKGSGNGEVAKQKKLIWATSCVEDKIPVGMHAVGLDGTDESDHVQVTIEECLEQHRAKIQNKSAEAIKTSQEHADTFTAVPVKQFAMPQAKAKEVQEH